MPLIVISGLPSSGKSARAKQLEDFFKSQNKKVILVSENRAIQNAGFEKNDFYSDSQKEKQVRSEMKSEAVRALNKEDVVILDGGNYIKGYRYELFCATKAARSNQCTLFIGIQKEKAWDFNEKRSVENHSQLSSDNTNVRYTREVFDELCMRFEEPHGNCRWDSPLFVCFPEDELDMKGIYSALYESKPLPANHSTQNAPLSSTNYLFELDRITQDIITDIMSARKVGILGPVKVKGSETKVDIPPNYNAIHLNRLRRQFLNYSKLHHTTSNNLDKISQMFVQFLNGHCNE